MNMSLHSLPASVCCAITALLIEAKTCAADWEKEKKLLHWSYRLFQEKLANFSWQIDCCLPNVNARSMVASRFPKNSKSMEIRQREKEGRNWGGTNHWNFCFRATGWISLLHIRIIFIFKSAGTCSNWKKKFGAEVNEKIWQHAEPTTWFHWSK